MRVRGLAFVGLVVGAFLIPSTTATAVASSPLTKSTTPSQHNLDRFFSSDGPDSLHESHNQGTVDEPRFWPQANSWLHSSLSESEREFLSLAVTGSVSSNYNINTQITSQQQSDTCATFTVTLRFNFPSNNVPSNFANQLKTDLVSYITSNSNSVSTPNVNVAPPSGYSYYSNEVYVSFQFSAISGGTTAGTQFYNFISGFVNSGSSIRNSNSFQYIDLSFSPNFVYTSSCNNNNLCSSSPCLNGGTCTAGSNSYTCQCASGYIGNSCEYNIFGSNKRNRLSGNSIPRGKSVTRPNVHAVKPSA